MASKIAFWPLYAPLAAAHTRPFSLQTLAVQLAVRGFDAQPGYGLRCPL